MSNAFDECPGAVVGDMPTTEHAEGSIVVDPTCSKQALTFLRRRFYVEESVGIESTGELKFVIRPKLRRTQNRPKVRTHWQKPIQFELPLKD